MIKNRFFIISISITLLILTSCMKVELFHNQKTDTALSKSAAENNEETQFKVYTNKNYGFKISYPKEWVISTEAGSGNDGAILYKNNDNLITAYSEMILPKEASDKNKAIQDVFKERGYSVAAITNVDGNKGFRCTIQKDGREDYLVVYENADKLYFFRATVSSEFFSQNKSLIEELSKSLTF